MNIKDDNINNKISFDVLLSLYADKEYVFSTNSFVQDFMAYENTLYQYTLSEVFKRPYSFKDMISVYNLIFLFCYLEETKYAKYMVNCRTLLHKFLYSGYIIKDCILCKSNIKFKLDNKLNINVPIQYGSEQIFFIDQKNLLSYPTSIRKHLESYIKSKSSENPIYTYKIFSSQPNQNEKKYEYQPRYYMPIHQIPEFLFSFLYFDGRKFPSNFEANSNSRIPKLCPQNQNSEFSYKLVVNQITDFLKNANHLDENELIYHSCNLDRLFLLNNLEILNKYYEVYISEYFLNTMINIFQLSYTEIALLKNTIITEIWNDTDFLAAGHNSSFIDFMLPFDIYFQYNLFSVGNTQKFKNLKGLEGLIQVISTCKENSRQIWKLSLFSIPTNVLSLKGEYLDIKETQYNIKELLKKNPFYLKYYNKDDKQYPKTTSSVQLNGPFSFEIIKNLLPQ